MLASLIDLYSQSSKWSNDNQGVVSITIFAVTLALGWASGIFSALRRKPKFTLSLNDGPTFCCTYRIGKKHADFEVHRTGIALFLVVANVGSSASSIENISVGYHWHLRPLTVQWLKYSVGWFWLTNQTVVLADFQVLIGENTKVFPFLIQKSFLHSVEPITYLEVGRSTAGVVYFEQTDSWGGGFPSVRAGRVRIKVRVQDVFGGYYTAKFTIPSVSIEEARKYNPAFGKTRAELHGEKLPFDQGSPCA
ncbi:hypothetical protein [Methylocapsa aurea]|uniref:hypothetical protein n=1 Tax=Methylocapsa aurea TaxID=663610 RepID=UPI000691F5AA|nr:hypothetical protein [Methylocapsa aurea]